MSKKWILPLLLFASAQNVLAAGKALEASYRSIPRPVVTPSAFNGICIYSDNLNGTGSIIKTNVQIEAGGRQVFSLTQTNNVLDATFMVDGDKKYLVVINSNGIILAINTSDISASTSFLKSFNTDTHGSVQASVVCVPN